MTRCVVVELESSDRRANREEEAANKRRAVHQEESNARCAVEKVEGNDRRAAEQEDAAHKRGLVEAHEGKRRRVVEDDEADHRRVVVGEQEAAKMRRAVEAAEASSRGSAERREGSERRALEEDEATNHRATEVTVEAVLSASATWAAEQHDQTDTQAEDSEAIADGPSDGGLKANPTTSSRGVLASRSPNSRERKQRQIGIAAARAALRERNGARYREVCSDNPLAGVLYLATLEQHGGPSSVPFRFGLALLRAAAMIDFTGASAEAVAKPASDASRKPASGVATPNPAVSSQQTRARHNRAQPPTFPFVEFLAAVADEAPEEAQNRFSCFLGLYYLTRAAVAATAQFSPRGNHSPARGNAAHALAPAAAAATLARRVLPNTVPSSGRSKTPSQPVQGSAAAALRRQQAERARTAATPPLAMVEGDAGSLAVKSHGASGPPPAAHAGDGLLSLASAQRPYRAYPFLAVLRDAAEASKLVPPPPFPFSPCPSEFNKDSVRRAALERQVAEPFGSRRKERVDSTPAFLRERREPGSHHLGRVAAAAEARFALSPASLPTLRMSRACLAPLNAWRKEEENERAAAALAARTALFQAAQQPARNRTAPL